MLQASSVRLEKAYIASRNAPERMLDEIARVDSEESLPGFIRHFWSEVEPGRKYVHGRHIECVADHLEAQTNGDILRLLINVPPGFMKSLMCNVFWPAWEWGPMNMPHLRSVNFSYSSSLTIRDNRRLRRLVSSPRYQRLWGSRVQLSREENNKVKFENMKQGWSLATSIGGVGTGERGDRVRIDDPHNVKEGESEAVRDSTIDWFNEALPSRMTEPESSTITCIMQRVHEKDVSGEILARDLGYEHLMLPMKFEPVRKCYTSVPKGRGSWMRYLGTRQMWLPDNWKPKSKDDFIFVDEFNNAERRFVYPQDWRKEEGELLFASRFTPKVVERDEKAMGEYATAGQMQQRPSPRGGLMFQRQWFEIVEAIPAGTRFCRHFDLAATELRVLGKGARTAGVLLGLCPDKSFIVVDMRAVMQQDPAAWIKLTCQEDRIRYGRVRVSLPQDPGQAGKIQAKNFVKNLAGFPVHTEIESGDKVTRAEPVASQAEVGNIKLLSGPWIPEFLDEVTKFPTGARKDIVDALSGAFADLISRSSGVLIEGEITGHH